MVIYSNWSKSTRSRLNEYITKNISAIAQLIRVRQYQQMSQNNNNTQLYLKSQIKIIISAFN